MTAIIITSSFVVLLLIFAFIFVRFIASDEKLEQWAKHQEEHGHKHAQEVLENYKKRSNRHK